MNDSPDIAGLFRDIDLLLKPDNPLGWCPDSKAHALAAIVLSLRPATTVEIGVFGGRSFLPMAMAHKALDHGLAIGIDPWDPSASVEGQVDPANVRWWSGLNHDMVYAHFVQHLRRLGLEKVTQILRFRSDEICVPEDIGLLHIDGNHGEQAYLDALRFAPNVRPGGFCVLDDLHWTGGAVGRAAGWLGENGFEYLYPLGSGAVYRRMA